MCSFRLCWSLHSLCVHSGCVGRFTLYVFIPVVLVASLSMCSFRLCWSLHALCVHSGCVGRFTLYVFNPVVLVASLVCFAQKLQNLEEEVDEVQVEIDRSHDVVVGP